MTKKLNIINLEKIKGVEIEPGMTVIKIEKHIHTYHIYVQSEVSPNDPKQYRLIHCILKRGSENNTEPYRWQLSNDSNVSYLYKDDIQSLDMFRYKLGLVIDNLPF